MNKLIILFALLLIVASCIDAQRNDCRARSCAIHTKELMCYRSKRGNCRLLTPCQRNNLNCKRDKKNQLEWTERSACRGIKAGSKQKCRPVPKKAFLVIVIAYTEAQRTCYTACHRGPPTPMRCVRDGNLCRKIRQCPLNGENCMRRERGLPPLNPINISRCRNIKSPSDRGICAPVRIPRSTPRECRNVPCIIESKRRLCYRSNKNNCRLLTSCQAKRLNCVRRTKNSLRRIDSRACRGLKAGDVKQRCRPIRKNEA